MNNFSFFVESKFDDDEEPVDFPYFKFILQGTILTIIYTK